jgi:hypothetical protein
VTRGQPCASTSIRSISDLEDVIGLIPLTRTGLVTYVARSKVIYARREEVTDMPKSTAVSVFAMSRDASLANLTA